MQLPSGQGADYPLSSRLGDHITCTTRCAGILCDSISDARILALFPDLQLKRIVDFQEFFSDMVIVPFSILQYPQTWPWHIRLSIDPLCQSSLPKLAKTDQELHFQFGCSFPWNSNLLHQHHRSQTKSPRNMGFVIVP